MTEGQLLALKAKAEQADFVTIRKADGTVTYEKLELVDGLEKNPCLIMQILALANSEAIPLRLLPTLFDNNNIFAQVAVETLIQEGLAQIMGSRYLVLTAAGNRWAAKALGSRLSRSEQNRPPEQVFMPKVDQNELNVLDAIAASGGEAPQTVITARAKLSQGDLAAALEALLRRHFVAVLPQPRGVVLYKLTDAGLACLQNSSRA